MAIFEIKEESYKEPNNLFNLIDYVYRDSVYFELFDLFPLGRDAFVNQFLYCQSCKGGVLHTRALHFILSFDTKGWEHEMDVSKVIESISAVYMAAKMVNLEGHQCFVGVHDNKKNRHLHIILNPVNLYTKKILHYGIGDYKKFKEALAKELFMRFGLALSGTSYVDESGRLRFDDNGVRLYEDRMYPWQPHLSQINGNRSDLLNPFIFCENKK